MTQVQQIKLPARKSTLRGSKYSLGDLRAGTDDCLQDDGIDVKKSKSRLRAAVTNFKKLPGNEHTKFTVREIEHEDGKVTVGVWRTA